MFNLSPVYSAHKSSNHKLSKNNKINPGTNFQKIYTNIKHKIFKQLVPSVLPLLKKVHKARTHWYHGPFRQFIITRFLKKYKKRNGQKQDVNIQELNNCLVASENGKLEDSRAVPSWVYWYQKEVSS